MSTIERAGQVDASLSSWLVTAYPLAMVNTQPTFGKLGDRVGHRRMFTLGALVVALSSFAPAATCTRRTSAGALCALW